MAARCKMVRSDVSNTVAELFAGVGGFRLGLDKSGWKTIFANQWEPGKKSQWAFDCYNSHFPDSLNLNVDVATVSSKDIPAHELLVGGFPCQDYSVASTLVNSKGIQGKKGVLWWEIYRIASDKKPRFILLENVDRLLKSPASQRGRDVSSMPQNMDSPREGGGPSSLRPVTRPSRRSSTARRSLMMCC